MSTLALALVLFLLICLLISAKTREKPEVVLNSAKHDIRKAHRILSADPNPSEAVAKAQAYLERWI